MKQRKYLNFYAAVGRKRVPDKDYPNDVNVLLDDMKYARVHGAIILPNSAEEYSFSYGNREGISIAKSNPRLKSIAPVPTTALLEMGENNYFDFLLESGAVALAASPSFRCAYTPKSIAPIAETLMRHNKPLVFTAAASENALLQIDAIASAYPQLPIIMYGCSWGQGRTVLEMLSRHQNLHFEISSFHVNNLFKISKEHFGIDRVLYGSAWPLKSMGAMKAYVEYADITEDDKNMVAHGNACRLFGLDINDFELYNDDECELDAIALEADAGIPISVPVFDAHTHMIENADKAVNNCIMMYSDCDGIAQKMQKLGIDSIITSPWSGICFDGIKGNEETLYAAKKHPGRFYGYLTCNVNYEEDLSKWTEYHKKYPDVFVGIKPYPAFQKFDYSDDICQPLFEYANEHCMPALIHAASVSDIDNVEPIVSKYPNVTFIIAHAGASFNAARRAVALCKKHENVVLEITYTTTCRGMIEFLVEQVGADRVLYGSDSPMRDATPQLAWVCYAKISPEDKKKILAENIKRIIEKRI